MGSVRVASPLAAAAVGAIVVGALGVGPLACGFDGTGTNPNAVGGAGTSSARPGVGDGGAGSGADGSAIDVGGDAMAAPDALALDGGLQPLTLTWAAPPADVDLETEGTLGWIHFGTETDNEQSYNEKASAVGLLPRPTVTGSSDVRTYEDNFTLFKWTNGTPMATNAGGSRNGIYSKTGFPKFTMNRLVGAEPQRWVVYAGVYKCKARFTVTLGAGPGIATATADLDNTNKAYARYVIEHRAPAPSTPLVVTWQLTQAYDPNNSNVTLAATTLSPIP